MKYLALCTFLLVFLTGCKDNKELPKEATEVAVSVDLQEKEDYSSSPIPVFNYSELEATYFNNDNDTTYVVNFWATWCKPCVKELPAFEELGENYKDMSVKVVLVSLDFPEKIEAGVVPFIEKRGIKSEVVLLDDPDANTWINSVSPEWSGAIPATVIINNKERKFYEQSFTYEELEKEVISL